MIQFKKIYNPKILLPEHDATSFKFTIKQNS